MKILHVVDSDRRRGGEMFAAGLIRELRKRNVEQHVAVLGGLTDGGVTYSAPAPTLARGRPTVPGLKLDVPLLIALRRLIHEKAPDIVQAHGGDTVKYATLAAAGRSVRLVHRAIGSPPEWVRKGPRRTAYAYLMSRASCVVAVSESVRADMLQVFGLSPEQVVTIPTAREAVVVSPKLGGEAIRKKLRIPAGACVILSLGALTWEKDPLTHLDVTTRVMALRPNCYHLIVGEGPLQSALTERIAERSLSDRVFLLGPSDAVGDLLDASDVMLLASRTEGMPGVLIEAGFAALPVAAYSIAGVPEVVVDGVTGLLAPAGNVDHLSRQVLRLVDDVERRKTLGSAARERAFATFEMGVIAPRYAALYQQLLSGPRQLPTWRSEVTSLATLHAVMTSTMILGSGRSSSATSGQR
jgi:glycosyltransferase involved in cell wall biosynthesis